MFTKNIKFKNFYGKKNFLINKKLLKIFKKDSLLENYPLLMSLNKDYKYSYKKKDISRFKKFSSFNLIGMGGSILGSEAIYEFLNHKISKKFYFYNNLQNKKFFKSNDKKINIIISKSGNTLETICNLNLIMKKQKKNKNLFITEKKNSFLFLIAKKLKAEIFEHKNFIGGRYSVLSEVGMLPAELMGLNESKFKRFNELVKKKKFMNSLIKNVSFIASYIREGKYNSVILNYDEKSNNLFKWYQQLTAESLGKKSKGIFPIISTMPKDNHSLLQLYLDGPKKNFFTFFSVKDNISNKLSKKNLSKKFDFLDEKNLNDILSSQKNATEIVFKRKKIPFRSFEILNRSEESIGELFCFFILETILLGRLLKVNPFDQPSVELIKTETKKILI
tara:strand:+ start:3652 stop:4824 length:1173 start_codon:yes stop_codon:yes gene_type:complete